MTHLAFIKCMKFLNTFYSKNLDQEQLESWYEYFCDISYTTLHKAVKEIIVESRFFPTASQLKEKCKIINIYKGINSYYLLLANCNDNVKKKSYEK